MCEILHLGTYAIVRIIYTTNCLVVFQIFDEGRSAVRTKNSLVSMVGVALSLSACVLLCPVSRINNKARIPTVPQIRLISFTPTHSSSIVIHYSGLLPFTLGF